eukprot:4646759-Pyramimonas_sp.AAC.2
MLTVSTSSLRWRFERTFEALRDASNKSIHPLKHVYSLFFFVYNGVCRHGVGPGGRAEGPSGARRAAQHAPQQGEPGLRALLAHTAPLQPREGNC